MIQGKRVLAVVPARGGSKGVPLKNVYPLLQVPLIAWVAPVVKALPIIDRTVVSTDHPEIARVARQAGLDVPFSRPAELAGDSVAAWPVLAHAVTETERLDSTRYDVVVNLEPTSPMRRPGEVGLAIDMLIEEGWDAVWTVSATDNKYHPLKQIVIKERIMSLYDPGGGAVVARQQLSTLYHRNGVAYALTRECLLEQRSLLGRRTGALVCRDAHISIDTLADFRAVEHLMQERGFVKPAGWETQE